jgi:transposase-like protein
MQTIKNRRAYPKALKLAAIKAAKTTSRTTAQIAEDFNISKATVCTWKRTAGIAKPQPQGLHRYQSALAQIKRYNTPEVITQETPNGAQTVIEYQGKTYKA